MFLSHIKCLLLTKGVNTPPSFVIMYVKFHPKFLNVKLAKQQGFQSTGTHLNDMKLFFVFTFQP